METEIKKLRDEFANAYAALLDRYTSRSKHKKSVASRYRALGADLLFAIDVAGEEISRFCTIFQKQNNEIRIHLAGGDFPVGLLEDGSTDTSPQRATSSLKALYFFLRAYHDVFAAICLELCGESGGPKTSMAKVLQKQSNLQKALKKSNPTYDRWFSKMRELRNHFKQGYPQHWECDQTGNVVIQFEETDQKGQVLTTSYSFEQTVEALFWSVTVTTWAAHSPALGNEEIPAPFDITGPYY